MTLNGLVQGCIPVMSYNFGAKKRARLYDSFKWGTVMAVILTGAAVILLLIFPDDILTVFNASEEMMSFGVPALRIMCVSYVFAAVSTMIASFMQSTKRVGFSLLINLLRQLVLLLPFMWILSGFMGMEGIWWSFMAAETLTLAAGVFLYVRHPVKFS